MASHHKKSFANFNINLIYFGFIFLFALVLFRLFFIQILNHQKYLLLAKDQQWDKYVIPPTRGDIFSTDNFLLAGTQNYYLMYGEPKKVKDPKGLSIRLADFFADLQLEEAKQTTDTINIKKIDETRETLKNKYFGLLSKDLLWVPLEHQISPEVRTKISELNEEGLGFEPEPVRFYPDKELAAHVLGFVASDEEGNKRGYYGIEGAFNEDLKGRGGYMMEEVDGRGVPILAGGIKQTEAIQGSTLYLTINRTIQYMVEKKLKEGVEKYDAKSGSVIVMDPFTGDILAMANYPTFNPAKFDDPADATEEDVTRKKLERRNVSIAETYEPGSVMKPVTIAAGIDQKIIDENTTFSDNGPVNYSGAWIDNWDGKHYGVLNIVELLQKSNNIGAAWVGHRVGSRNLHKYLSQFGFGKKTNIELEGEDTGILRDYQTWTDIDLANISFGQGISASPLQVVNAFNVFANGGFLMQPRMVSKVIDKGKVIDIPSKVVGRTVSKQTAERMVSMLEKAAEGGEAKFFVLKNYRISGKTGTAQIPLEGKYSPDKTNATFVGFLTQSRKFSMIVKLNEPTATIFASESAVPLWMNIANELVKIYSLPSDKSAE